MMNAFGKAREPFLFVINFDCSEFIIERLDVLQTSGIRCVFQDEFIRFSNQGESLPPDAGIRIEKELPDPVTYSRAFDIVHQNLQYGNSFLTNLTAETRIESNYSLDEIFEVAQAKYKLKVQNKFVCFSPESFLRISNQGKVSSFPMKGTIEASEADAEETILNDFKEKYEHTTIVDLIRNDLSKVCDKVWVERFRYLEKITRQDGTQLLQVSSEISGMLSENWNEKIGDILLDLLPAGSVSGAPKEKTTKIIREAEKLTYQLTDGRGFYTGIFGIFDGKKLDSAVLIRFIEKTADGLVFKSGGGITARSIREKEFDELISKIYVPIL
jgi:para-aminobenzoate synthetase component 1